MGKRAKDNDELSSGENQFCIEYVEIERNHPGTKPDASKAFRRAFAKKTKNWKNNTIAARACELLKRGNIQVRIQELREITIKKATGKYAVTVENLISEYAKLAFTNMPDFVTPGKNEITLKQFQELTEEQRACISEIEWYETKYGSRVKFKVHDKKGALDSLGRYLQIFNDKMTLGIDHKTLDIILAALPPEYAQQVRQALVTLLVKGK